MNLGDKIRSGSSWLISGKTASRVVEFCFGVVMARLLFPSDFGMLITLQIFTGVAGFLAGGGLGQALIRFDNVTAVHFRVVFTAQLIIGATIYTALYLLAPMVAVWFENPLYEQLLVVSALSFLFRPFNNLPAAKLSREYRFRELAIVQFFRPIMTGTISVVMALNGFGVWSLVLGGLLGALCSLPLLYWFTRWKPALSFNFGMARELAAYGVKFQINDLIVYFKSVAPNAIISKLLGPAQLGLFNKGDSLTLIPLQLIGAPVGQTVFRGLASVKDDLNASRYIYFRTLTLLTVYLFPIYILMHWLAEPFILFVYGEKWLGAAAVMNILAVVGLVKTIIRPAGMLIGAQDKLLQESRVHLESLILIVGACLLFYEGGIEQIALVYIGIFSYTALRMTSIALGSVGAKWQSFGRALLPSLLLNSLLFTFLFFLDSVVTEYFGSHEFLYLLVMGTLGSVFYLLLFLYMPLSQLSSEANRAKKQMQRILSIGKS